MTVCAAAVAHALGCRDGADPGTIVELIDELERAGWVDAAVGGRPREWPSIRVGAGAQARDALRWLADDEAMVIRTHRHVSCVAAGYIVDTDPPPGGALRSRRKVLGVLHIRCLRC